MGNIFWRFMKASPDAVGWAIAAFVWAVTVQLAVVTTMGLFRYHSIAEDSQVYDYVWFIYLEMPSTLPMIFAYSGATTAIMLSVGIYIRIGFTIGELPYAIRHRPLRFVWEIVLPFLCIAVLFAGTLFGQPILVFLGSLILAAFFSQQFVSIWIRWARTMVKSATDEDAEIEATPTDGGGQKPEPEIDRLSSIIEDFNARFGNVEWKDKDKIDRVIAEELPAKVAADKAYQNAAGHSDEQNARIELNRALEQAVTDMLADHADLFKLFSDNPSFRQWLSETIFASTYNKAA